MRLRSVLAALAVLSVAACGEAGQAIGDMKSAAVDLGKEAAKAAAEVVDTKTACTLAGQNEAFCGCLQTELGAKISPAHIDAIASVVKQSIGGGSVEKAAEESPALDDKTRQAVISCGVKGAVGAATESAAEQ